jgi:hypothetical protein
VFQYAPLPTVQKFSREGKFLSEFAVEGYAVERQAEMARRFLSTKSPSRVGGIIVITSATIDPRTGRLWLSTNGPSKSGIVCEYDPVGEKLHEYAFFLDLLWPERGYVLYTDDLIVRFPFIYIFTRDRAFRFDLRNSLSQDNAPSLLEKQAPCPAEQTWRDCKTNCGTPSNPGDDKDCKAELAAQVQIGPPVIVVDSSCQESSMKCTASVTTCNTQTGVQVPHGPITLNCESGGDGCDEEAEAICNDPHSPQCGEWDPINCVCNPPPGECGSGQAGCGCSPVVVDVFGDGFELTNGAGGVNFDLNGDGYAKRLSWTAEGVDDAFLALDRNGNGKIDDGTELFGNYTSQPSSSTPNEFLALAEYDKPENGGNRDGKINSADAIYSSLRLWQDANHDGISNPSELFTLPSLGVAAIDLDYRESRRRDQWGNEFRYRAKVYGANGQHLGRWAYDVFLISQP